MSRRPPPPSDEALQGLAKHRDAVSQEKRRAIERAIKHARKINGPINIATVAARDRAQRKTVYKHRDLVAVIDQYRRQQPPAYLASSSRETSIVAALRVQLAAKNETISRLRATAAEQESTIAMLYGQLDTRSRR